MKRKLFTALLAAIMALILCACGSNKPANNTQSTSTGAPSGNSDDLIGGDTINPLTGLPQSEDASDPDAQGPANSDPDNIADRDTQQSAAPSSTELSGLVILTVDCDNSRMGRRIFNCDISCLNPMTGEQTLISHFLFGDVDTERSYLLPNGFKNLVQGDNVMRENWFSPDYQLLAATRVTVGDGAHQIGWIKGEKFFNMSEKLGLVPENDFETPPRYMAAGFTEDGMYVFYKLSPDESERTYYYVPLDNLSPDQVKEGVVMAESDTNVTDYISNSLCVMNTEDQISRIYNVETEELTDYIPGDNRFSWNGVVSPDGAKIAFMSRTKIGLEVNIFIMSLFADGMPTEVSVPSNIVLMIQEECERGAAMNYDTRSMLIDWR